MPPFNRNTGDDGAFISSQECHGDVAGQPCGRLKVRHRGILVCAVCDDFKTWPDHNGGRKR